MSLTRQPSRDLSSIIGLKNKNPFEGDEVCIGNSLAEMIGTRIHTLGELNHTEIDNFFRPKKSILKSLKIPPRPWKLMMEMITHNRNDYPQYLSASMSNAKSHAASVSISSRDGTNRMIWYSDPNGLSGMKWLEKIQWDDFHAKYGDKFTKGNVTLEKLINDKPPIYLNSWETATYGVALTLKIYRESENYEELKKQLDLFRTGIVSTGNGGSKKYQFPEENIMCALFLIKKMTNSDYVTIVSPLFSMREIGPQGISGDVCFKKRRNNNSLSRIFKNINSNEKSGSCVVWSDIYDTFMRNYWNTFTNTYELIAFLRENPFVGQADPIELIGRVMFEKIVDKDLRNFMLELAKMIPDPSELECMEKSEDSSNCITKYHSDLLDIYDTITKTWNKFRIVNPRNTIRFIKALSNNKTDRMSIHRWNIMVSRIYLKFSFLTEITIFNLVFILLSCKHDKFFS